MSNNIIIVSWPHGKEAFYGIVTNKSYPLIYGFGSNLYAARCVKSLGADYIDKTLFTNYDLNSLESFEEVM